MNKIYCKLLWIFLIPITVFAQDPISWSKHIISDTLEKAKKNVVIDLDNDGDLDIVCIANPEGNGSEDNQKINVMWFENNGGESFTQHDIDSSFVSARGLACGDLTGNGYADVIAGCSRSAPLVWYENDGTPASGVWTKDSLGGAAPLNYSIMVADIDKDGNQDILDGMGSDASGATSGTDTIRWFENSGGSSPTFTQHLICTTYSSPSGVYAADFDNDSDLDVVGMAWTEISATAQQDEDVRWWAQGSGNSWTQTQVIQQYYAGNDVTAVDINQSGTIDIVGAGYKVNSLDWWSNNGSGSNRFSSINVIASDFQRSRNVKVADIDGDGDLDAAAAADYDGEISWFKNNGEQSFTEHNVNNSFTYAYFVSTADIDGDGDIDLIGTAQDAHETGETIEGQLAWWENDLEDKQTIAAGDQAPVNFWNAKVAVDFSSGSAGDVSVFYNHGENSNRDSVQSGVVDHIALKGYYTIVADKGTYQCDIHFSYAGISEWSAINDEADLLICLWDDVSEEWKKAGTSQTVNAANDSILVRGLGGKLKRYSLFTIGSSTTDNALPVELLTFEAQVMKDGVRLFWQTESEIENQGFEILRKSADDSSYHLLSSYLINKNLAGLGTSAFGGEYEYFDRNVQWGKTYFYKLIDVTYNGQKFEHKKLSVDFVPENIIKITGLELPETMRLYQNYPNPFNSATMIEFSIPKLKRVDVSNVNLDIYNLLGQRVRVLYKGQLAAGNYTLRWDGQNEAGISAASGVYIYRLQVNNRITAKRLTITK